MKNVASLRSAFTLVELLVVITILSIISVVAYQNFGGAVDKALSGRKISDVSTIETALQQYKVDNGSYPSAATGGLAASSNLWGYNDANGSAEANPSNNITVTYTGDAVQTVVPAGSLGGGRVYGAGAWADGQTEARQIGAKGTISQDELGKRYLSKDLYDPELGDVSVAGSSNTMIDFGIGRYVYATYKKNKGDGDWTSNRTGDGYNIAFTVKKEGSDKYLTKIVGDYDAESCYDDVATCPDNLIGLANGEEEDADSNNGDYGVPYAVTDFFSN